MAKYRGSLARVGVPALPIVGPARVCIALASDQPLVADAVEVALASRHFDVRRLAWPEGPSVESQLSGTEPHVALLIYEVDTALRRAAAAALIRAWSGLWLVLTGSTVGAIHGGLLDAGATVVRTHGVGLEQVEALLRRLASGRNVEPAERREALIGQWHGMRHERELQARLDLLTSRERDVLGLIAKGCSTRQAAGLLRVSEATVSIHVRAILRKLEVHSRLAAVAAVRTLDEVSAAVTRPASSKAHK